MEVFPGEASWWGCIGQLHVPLASMSPPLGLQHQRTNAKGDLGVTGRGAQRMLRSEDPPCQGSFIFSPSIPSVYIAEYSRMQEK